ncbi:uncharacterized protein STEHIDRAFT_159221 [Stereum hirsutum FP-91666 SS1]|uniref:uncharacterized protein n=1 Tax=Stereum hirsutum (strain FP-91666) TaxID=721885 RepID=UPI0004449A24|nr:uncharacterized protein STEHIDRAFT_159221 [Stereum hirsutum FP-91666 SS1]EIM84556.1 hypothetical protein STEHIDRAFT_159221 [Stereum hirsutum FP-91666 SS1]
MPLCFGLDVSVAAIGVGSEARQTLVNLAQNNEEYHQLSKLEKDKLLKMCTDHRDENIHITKAVHIRDSGKNAAHDVTRAWNAIQNEAMDATAKTQEFCDMWNAVGFVEEEQGHGLRFWMCVDKDRVREETANDDPFPLLVAARDENLRCVNSAHKLEAFGFKHIVLFDDTCENVHRAAVADGLRTGVAGTSDLRHGIDGRKFFDDVFAALYDEVDKTDTIFAEVGPAFSEGSDPVKNRTFRCD